MRVAAGENSAESLQQFDAGTRANTGASATGPSLPVVNEWLAARSTHVRSSTKRSKVSHRTDLNALSQRGKCADSNSPCDLDSRWVA
jgi:hypothetical protein